MLSFTRFTLKQGERPAFFRAQKTLCEHVSKHEPGTPLYLLFADRQDPEIAWIYARYADAAAKQAHLSSEVYKQATALSQPLIAAVEDLDVAVLNQKLPAAAGGQKRFVP